METLTFPVGAQGGATLVLIIPLIDDNIAEFNEQFRLTASVRGSGIGIYTGLTHSRSIRITDDDREFTIPLQSIHICMCTCNINKLDKEYSHQKAVVVFLCFSISM